MKYFLLAALLLLGIGFLGCQSVSLTDQKEQIENLEKSQALIAESADTIGQSLAQIEALTDDQQIIQIVATAQEANATTKKEVASQAVTIGNVKKNSEIKDNEIKALEKKIGLMKFWGFIGGFIVALVAFAAGFVLKKFL